MGREITIKLRMKDNDIYEQFVCGRDDATNYIASLVYAKRMDLPEIDEDNLSEGELGDRYSLIYSFDNDREELDNLIHNLQDYYDKDLREIYKARDTLEALTTVRKNCQSMEEFSKFTDALEETENWLMENDYSRAGRLLEFIRECENIANKLIYPCKLVILLSE